MSKVCSKCGKNIPNDDVHFCPECGFKFNDSKKITHKLRNSEDDWIKNLLWIFDEKTGETRISKAKLIGIIIFILYVLWSIIVSGDYLRMGLLPYMVIMFSSLIAGVIYYCICRGIGFIVRKLI